MELVYLWIEDYENIKNQGFTLNGKSTCELSTNNTLCL